jgi:hypothetical protein
MLDRYHCDGDSHTYVNIKQQPNDAADAARLHGEMRVKATEEIASATVNHLGANNEVVFLRADVYPCVQTFNTKVRLLFKINGHLYDIVTENDEMKIRNAVCENVLASVMSQALQQMTYYDKNILLKTK